jgi:hypothetical protein
MGWWLLWASLAVHIPIGLVALRNSPTHSGDFDNYYEIGLKPGRPYVDFQVEFPVATALTFRTLAPLTATRARFGRVLVILSFAANLAIVAALAWAWGVEAAACYAFIMIPLLDLFLLRMDLWPTALATLSAAAWRRGRPVLTALAIVAGAAFKLWPVMLLPLLLVRRTARQRTLGLTTLVATGLFVLGIWLWVAGPSGLYQVVTFRGARGWEVESTVGAVWMLFERDSMRVESGAWRIGTTFGPLSILMFVLGAAPCMWMIWRGARDGRLGTGWAGGISALLVMSALLSAQYCVWLAPAAGMAWTERDRRIGVATGIAVFLTNLVYKDFNALLHGVPRAIALVNGRNLFLIFLAIMAARLLIGGASDRLDAREPIPDAATT